MKEEKDFTVTVTFTFNCAFPQASAQYVVLNHHHTVQALIQSMNQSAKVWITPTEAASDGATSIWHADVL